MKIALVNHNLGSGGAEKLIHDMAIEMKNRGENVEVVLLTSIGGVYENSLYSHGVNVIHLSNKWDIYSPKNIFRLVKILKKYDIVHTHTYSAQLWTAFATYFLPENIKYITTEHSTSNGRRGKWYFKILDRWMYSRYNNVVSITEEVKRELISWIGKNENLQFKVIKNGIFLECYNNAIPLDRKLLNLSEQDKVLLMIARFDKPKDHKTVINALRNLEEKYKLILVGKGELEQKIKEQVKELSLEERVYFLGYRKDIPEILKMSDVSILSSDYEGLPLSALEAMASGTPFVATEVSGLKDLVKGAGVTFELGNEIELSKIIAEICKNEEYSNKISKNCIERSKEYDIKNTVEDYIKTYSD